MESSHRDQIFILTELSILRGAVAQVEQAARIKAERIATGEHLLVETRRHLAAIAELLGLNPQSNRLSKQ